MYRLLNLLGFVAFVAGAAFLGYALYLLLTVILGVNPWGTARPAGGRDTLISAAVIGLILLVVGWLLGRASARLEWRGRVVPLRGPLSAPAA